MTLISQIDTHAKTVVTTSYSMSISEIIAMYQEGDLRIRPEYQRLYRWSLEQKSRFIESILLDIPMPAIFVAEEQDSRWEIIDGLQRVSTILETVGALKSADGTIKNPLRLLRTRYLPDLEGMQWLNENSLLQLPDSVKIKIKRARIDVSILRKASDRLAKFEIFQRLNTGGTKATDQEVRSCVVLMYNQDFFKFVSELSNYEPYRNCFVFSENQIDEAFDQELVTRFIVFVKSTIEELSGIPELGSFLTERITTYAESNNFDFERIKHAFCTTFDLLNSALGEDSFKKYNKQKGKYFGQSLVSLYEMVAIGLGANNYQGTKTLTKEELADKHKFIWEVVTEEIPSSIGSGVRASTRIPKTVGFGTRWAAGNVSTND